MNKIVKQLSELLKVKDAESFAKAISSETDTDYELPKLVVRTSEEEDTFKENISKDVKEKAFKDAFEIQIKNLKKDTGLDFEGKDPKDFLENYKSKILKEAQIEPEKKVSELEKSLDNLRTQLTEKENKYKELESNVSRKELQYKAESLIPELPEGVGLSKQEARDLFFLQHEIKEDGIYRNGNKLKDSQESALDLDAAVKGFVSEKGWDKAPTVPTGRGGGAGQGNQAPSVPTNEEEYNSYLKDKGLHPGSREAQDLLRQAVDANPDNF